MNTIQATGRRAQRPAVRRSASSNAAVPAVPSTLSLIHI